MPRLPGGINACLLVFDSFAPSGAGLSGRALLPVHAVRETSARVCVLPPVKSAGFEKVVDRRNDGWYSTNVLKQESRVSTLTQTPQGRFEVHIMQGLPVVCYVSG